MKVVPGRMYVLKRCKENKSSAVSLGRWYTVDDRDGGSMRTHTLARLRYGSLVLAVSEEGYAIIDDSVVPLERTRTIVVSKDGTIGHVMTMFLGEVHG